MATHSSILVWRIPWTEERGLQFAAAAKSRQSCPTLCDPIDGSPPGSPVPGILQARVLEWGAIAFSVNIFISHLLFLSGCAGLSLLHGTFSGCRARASHRGGFLCGEPRPQGKRAQQLRLPGPRAQAQWCRGLVDPRHVGSSQTRDQISVPSLAAGLLTAGPLVKSFKSLSLRISFWLLALLLFFFLVVYLLMKPGSPLHGFPPSELC